MRCTVLSSGIHARRGARCRSVQGTCSTIIKPQSLDTNSEYKRHKACVPALLPSCGAGCRTQYSSNAGSGESLLIAFGCSTSMASDGHTTFKVFKSLGISGVSACIAESVTLPLDTAKVLMLRVCKRLSWFARAGLASTPSLHHLQTTCEGLLPCRSVYSCRIAQQARSKPGRSGLCATSMSTKGQRRCSRCAAHLSGVRCAHGCSASGSVASSPPSGRAFE